MKKIKIANAPCSWGVLEFELEGEAMGYQQVLDEIAATGYAGTELGDWGFMPTDPGQLRAAIQQRNLELLGAFVPVALSDESAHAEGIERALKTAGLMHGAGYADAFIVLADNNGTVPERTRNAGRVQAGQLLPLAQYKTIAKGADALALAVKEKYGMRTVFHHHGAGYVETPQEIDWLLEFTDPQLVGLCFDTGHYRLGGGADPLAALEKYYSRVWHVHFKDFNPEVAMMSAVNNWDYFESVRNGIFCELGKGDVPFEAISKFLDSRNYEGWIVVEQDVLPGMGAPKVCAQHNRDFLKSIGL
ncbi:TIM barrel protein [Flavihumibacter profundi]|uniref:TIM barrel protein n=1 Tax=Flavihumibacter profundi TaxID=2716883 RepID=UPI001CC59F53|nr:TIM barrel protein [Flavihumibacter profundi]MBZ5858040.1 TIM barrel protein [Flavihumibacter profundi]